MVPVRPFDLLTTIVAGAFGAAVATFLVGASLVLVVPAALGVGAVAVVADRSRRTPR
jgi:hypothetical protein